MDHLIIDLEMCKVARGARSKDYKYANEIIQIGAVLLDEDFAEIGTMSRYVHPEYGMIDSFITSLTGIDDSNVRKAPLLKEALRSMISWLGGREYNVYAWSGSDLKQLSCEIRAKGIEDEDIASFLDATRWIDYQAVFMERYGFGRQKSLEEALERCGIVSVGRLHDGLDDALNTGALIAKLEKDPSFKLVGPIAEETSYTPVCSTLGELFAGLKLQFGN